MGGTDGIEKPAHQVRIGYDFEMGTTEVTIGQFRAFLQATGYPTDGEKVGVSWTRGPDTDWQSEDAVDWCRATRDQSDDHPAIFISWYDAMAFCHWLSGQTGQEIRLPSEAEWEYACRAGTTGLYAGELSEMGWSQYNACGRTHPVAQKQPNAWGLYDMHGNVWEWCLDFFQPNYEGVPTDGRPRWEVASARRTWSHAAVLSAIRRAGWPPAAAWAASPMQPRQQWLSPRPGAKGYGRPEGAIAKGTLFSRAGRPGACGGKAGRTGAPGHQVAPRGIRRNALLLLSPAESGEAFGQASPTLPGAVRRDKHCVGQAGDIQLPGADHGRSEHDHGRRQGNRQ